MPLVFDLDNNDIIVSGEHLLEYDEKFVEKWKCLKNAGRK